MATEQRERMGEETGDKYKEKQVEEIVLSW